MFPAQLLRSRTIILLYFTTAGAAAALAVPIYYLPLFFQFTKSDSAIQAAVRLLPFVTLNIVSMMVSGSILPLSGRYMPWYVPSGILVITGGTLMFYVTATTSTAAVYGFEILIAVGAGLIQQVGYSVAAAVVKPHEVPAAIGLMNVAQIGSVAIALTISGAIFQNLGFSELKTALAEYKFSAGEIRAALAGVQSTILSQADEKLLAVVINAVVNTISKLYALVIAAGALILLSAVFMKREKLQLNPSAAG
jgi:hypothetical protein